MLIHATTFFGVTAMLLSILGKVCFVIILVIPYIAFIRKKEFAPKIQLLCHPGLSSIQADIVTYDWPHMWQYQSSVVINQSVCRWTSPCEHETEAKKLAGARRPNHFCFCFLIDLNVYKAKICCYSILDLRAPGQPCHCFSHCEFGWSN